METPTVDTQAIAVDTLKTLDEFTGFLAKATIKVGRLFASQTFPDAHEEMIQLVDGIGTFHESVTLARAVLGIAADDRTTLLEADFKSILEDLAAFHERKQYTYVAELLDQHLSANLLEWREVALPELMVAAAQAAT